LAISDYQSLSDYVTSIRDVVDSQRDTTPQELGIFDPINNIKVVLDSTSHLAVDNYLETLIHEYLHKLGAKDKYSETPEQACLTNSETGQEYDGHDIMCHRIKVDTGSYLNPPLVDLIISEETAREINWL